MQALILAAGMGRRLGTLTDNNTKCMVKVNDTTLIERLLGQLSHLNLKRVVIVIGYEGEKLRNFVGDNYRGMKIEYIDNPIYDKTNNIYSLSLAKKELMEDDTLLIESDLIFDESIFTRVLESEAKNLAVVAKYESWMDGTMVRIDDENNIINFIPKRAFRYQDIDCYYKTVNIYKFSKEFAKNEYIPFLEAYIHALGNNEYYEQVLRVITILDNCNLKALVLNDENWYEIDDVQDLDIAETIFCPAEKKLQKYAGRYGGYWRFPKMLDFCYLVNPYFPPKKMLDELKSNFECLLTQYPSGMKVNSMLMGKNFGIREDYVCVGNGAAELIKSVMESTSGKVGVVSPTFEEYPNRRNADEVVTFYPQKEKDFAYSAQDLMDFFGNKGVTTLLVVNPDNPSGNFIPYEGLMELMVWTRERGIELIVDESFVDFSESGTDNSLLRNDVLEANPHMMVIKSISKSYGVPGIRLGVLASADVEKIGIVRKDVAIWNVNSFGEYYMQIFGKYEKVYKEACSLFVAERRRFMEALQGIDYLRVIPSQANYFLCEVRDGRTSTEIAERLLNEYNILIKDCSNKKAMKGYNYIRIAVRNMADNDRLVEALRKL